MSRLGGVKSFLFSGVSYLVIGFIFMYLYSGYYLQYQSDYVMLGLLFVVFVALAGLGATVTRRVLR